MATKLIVARETQPTSVPLPSAGSCERIPLGLELEWVGTRCSASVLGLPSRTRSSASLPANFSQLPGEGLRVRGFLFVPRWAKGADSNDFDRIRTKHVPVSPKSDAQ